jgi:hypothetical protein
LPAPERFVETEGIEDGGGEITDLTPSLKKQFGDSIAKQEIIKSNLKRAGIEID